MNSIQPQPNITSRIIDEVTQSAYQSRIKRIAYPEVTGILVCLAAVIFIAFHFSKLDTVLLQAAGILCMLLLVTISACSFYSIKGLYKIPATTQPFAAVLRSFAAQKIRFYKLQQANMLLGYLLLVTVIILIALFFNGNDITGNKLFWTFSFCTGYIFILFANRYIAKYYRKQVEDAAGVLEDLQQEPGT